MTLAAAFGMAPSYPFPPLAVRHIGAVLERFPIKPMRLSSLRAKRSKPEPAGSPRRFAPRDDGSGWSETG